MRGGRGLPISAHSQQLKSHPAHLWLLNLWCSAVGERVQETGVVCGRMCRFCKPGTNGPWVGHQPHSKRARPLHQPPHPPRLDVLRKQRNQPFRSLPFQIKTMYKASVQRWRKGLERPAWAAAESRWGHPWSSGASLSQCCGNFHRVPELSMLPSNMATPMPAI